MLYIFAKAVRIISISVSSVGYLIMFYLLFGTMADVFMRFVFGYPIQGVIEYCTLCLPVIVFMGIAYVQLMEGHIRVSFLSERLRPKVKARVEIFVLVISLIFAIGMSIETWKAALYSFSIKEFYWGGGAGQKIPVWWAKFTLPIGFWALSLQYISDIVNKAARVTRE